MMYSASALNRRIAVVEAELLGQVVMERARAGGHVLHGVLLAITFLAQ